MTENLYGGIEAGGTKFVCAVGNSNGYIKDKIFIETKEFESTILAVINYFRQYNIVSLGIGSFGPLDLDTKSETFGWIKNTPKVGWQNKNIKGKLENSLNVPIYVNTDVGCAGLGEYYFGKTQGVDNLFYITVGTGIGGALIIDGEIYQGLSHLEVGHMRIPYDVENSNGFCSFHNTCLEGLASGFAIQHKWGYGGENLTDNDEVWDLESTYLAEGVGNIITTLSPKKIVIGGGVLNHPGLIDDIRSKVSILFNGYLPLPNLEDYITKSDDYLNGVKGAIYFALEQNS